MKETALIILLCLVTLSQTKISKLDQFLEVFDYTYDDIVVEKGENWAEKYVIQQIKKCDLKLPDGKVIDIRDLARDAPPDYSVVGPKGFKYFFNVCRNTIMTCNGYDDAVAVQYGTGKN